MTSSQFEVHPQLVADTVPVGDTELCRVLLAKDARYVWIILVPRREGLRELHDLDPLDQIQLMAEATHMSSSLQDIFEAGKTNVAALGNMVPQLHIHIIMRNEGDPAWPGPIWNVGDPQEYDADELSARLSAIQSCLP